MILYLVIAIMPVLLASLFGNINHNKTKYCITIGFIIFLFLALRANTIGSTDTQNYYNTMVRAINSSSWKSFYNNNLYETGAQFFIWILSRLFHEPQWLIVVTSAIYVSSIIYLIANNSSNLPLSLTMYICLGMMMFEMQGMRQSIAISICLFAFEMAKQRKIIPFALLILLAVQFHQTAIVFVVSYFICGMKLNKKNIILMLLACIAMILLSTKIIQFANIFFDRNYTSVVENGGFVATAIYFIIIILALLVSRQPFEANEKSGFFFALLLGGTCYIMRYIGSLAAERISFYFIFSQCVVLPNTIIDGRLTAQSRKIMIASVWTLSILLFAYRLNGSNFLPYVFFWNI